MLRPFSRVVVLAALGGLIAAVAAQAAPQTVVASPNRILRVVQDGSRLAWTGHSPEALPMCGDELFVRSFESGRETTFPALCIMGELALGGNRLLWTEDASTSHVTRILFTASVADPKAAWLQRFSVSGSFGGSEPTGLGGDGPSLLFSWLSFVIPDTCDFDAPPCVMPLRRGRLARVVGRSPEALPSVPPASLLAVSRSRIAMAPAPDEWSWPHDRVPLPVADGSVEVRSAVSGALVTSFVPTGRVLALGVTPEKVAVLVQRDSRNKWIEVYRADDGELLRETPVMRAIAGRLDMAGDLVAYRVGNRVLVLDTGTGAKHLVGWPGTHVGSVSIEGRRVVWAENGYIGEHMVHRIRAATVAG